MVVHAKFRECFEVIRHQHSRIIHMRQFVDLQENIPALALGFTNVDFSGKFANLMLTEWLTPHINTPRSGSLERKTFTFWLITLNFFFFFVFAWLDILKGVCANYRDSLRRLNHSGYDEKDASLSTPSATLLCRTINIPIWFSDFP